MIGISLLSLIDLELHQQLRAEPQKGEYGRVLQWAGTLQGLCPTLVLPLVPHQKTASSLLVFAQFLPSVG